MYTVTVCITDSNSKKCKLVSYLLMFVILFANYSEMCFIIYCENARDKCLVARPKLLGGLLKTCGVNVLSTLLKHRKVFSCTDCPLPST